MDNGLFKAAMDGEVEILRQNKDQLEFQLTPIKNTVLHIAARFGRRECVVEILKMQPKLLKWVNKKGDTALHIASGEGHTDIVRELYICAEALDMDIESGDGAADQPMTRMPNEEGDTALHMAVRKCGVKEVVELLTKKDPHFSCHANKAGESPLYLAAERELRDLVSVILQTCSAPDHRGPKGRTALHAAVICGHGGMVSDILEKIKPSLTTIADEDDWTPLHYAAYFNYVEILKQLLDSDKSAAYKADKEGRTALHIAATCGHTDTMEKLISQCPDCFELVDRRGRNVLHIAVESNEGRAVKLILENHSLNSLINEMDVDGNTPLHLLATSGHYIPSLIRHPAVDKNSYNKKNLTALDLASCTQGFSPMKSLVWRHLKIAGAIRGRRNVISKDDSERGDTTTREHLKKVEETHLIVAALIATVTFAAGFTLPGGYNGSEGPDHGIAILTRKVAFKAFFITDSVALVLSTSAVFLYFITALHANQTKLFNRIVWAFCLTILAMGSMMLAFVTGTYAALPSSSGLTIAVCVVASCFFFIYLFVLKKLYFDKVSKKSPFSNHGRPLKDT